MIRKRLLAETVQIAMQTVEQLWHWTRSARLQLQGYQCLYSLLAADLLNAPSGSIRACQRLSLTLNGWL